MKNWPQAFISLCGCKNSLKFCFRKEMTGLRLLLWNYRISLEQLWLRDFGIVMIEYLCVPGGGWCIMYFSF